jgi:hypothetical protein
VDNLVAVPHAEGIDILKNELFERIKKFELIDDEDVSYFQSTVHSVHTDEDEVLTVIVIIPKEDHFTNWNKIVRILSDDGKIIADIQTPAIQFVKGVGGEQVVKLAVSGDKPMDIIFKSSEYITPAEANELYLRPIIANTNYMLQMNLKLIEKGIILND